jgi:type 2 lantibiotic biosynthesis protein LanM
MPSSASDLSAIAARAASIYERAAATTRRDVDTAASDPDPAAAEAVHAWNRAFSPGDPAAFLKRLTWDDLDLAMVLAAAADAGPAVADRSWTIWLERASQQARALAIEVASGEFVDDPALHVPFEEIWTAFRRAAAAAVEPGDGGRAEVASDVVASLERQLCEELTRQGELALFEQLRDSGYSTFVTRMLDQGLAPLFDEYPALARLLAGLTSDWADATREFLARLRDDRGVIAAAFGGDPGAAISIEPGLSDPHHGRRRVAAVQFASGLRLVYKPRAVQLERAFNDFLRWINAHLTVPVRTLKVIDRGAYGWIEFAAHEPAVDRVDAARRFRQSGSLLCIAHLLGAQDLHMENVVITSDGPVVVDTEMLLQPEADTARSVLATGMVSLITVTADGAVYDSGGLRGQITGPLPFAQRVWRGLRTDTLRYDDEPAYRSAGRHQVLLNGIAQDPSTYTDDIVQGFDETYRCLMDHRSEIDRADGPLRAFAPASARVTLRPTNQYAMLSVVLAGPRYQRSGVARSTAVDVLHRVFAGEEQRPALWPAAVEERRAIARLDVPYFSVRCDGTDLMCDGKAVVVGHFERSGLAAAVSRLERLSDRDHDEQARRLRRALSESCTSRFNAADVQGVDVRERAIAIARWIAHEMLSRAEHSPDGLIWRYRVVADSQLSPHQLYDGTLGPVLLLSALAAATDEPAWREHAFSALRPLRRAIESDELIEPATRPNIGGADGLGSIIYGLTVAGSLLGDRHPIELASRIARHLPDQIGTDEYLDVVDGAAGAALGLLVLFDATADAQVLQAAVACGEHLVERSIPAGDDARAWPSPTGARLLGFAHGAAGIVCALARLYRATGDERFREAAEAGSRFLARQFHERACNYAIAAAG